MSLQMVLVGLIVVACALQAAWTLMPARARAAAATTLLRLPMHWPPVLDKRLRKAASGASTGCGGCDSCGSVKPDAANQVKPITVHRRVRR